MSGVNANMPAARSIARKRLANAMFDSFISRTIGDMHRLKCVRSKRGGACEKWLSPRRGARLCRLGEPVKSELFCVKKRWQKMKASRPWIVVCVNETSVYLLSVLGDLTKENGGRELVCGRNEVVDVKS